MKFKTQWPTYFPEITSG